MTIAVVTDSTASLDPDDAAAEGITVVPTTVIIGAQIYTEGADVSSQMIADSLASFVPVSTSRPSPEAFESVYESLAAQGAEAIVSVHLSSRISGTVDSARLAASRVSVPVHVVDTLQAGLATGFAAGCAARARDGGVEAMVAAAERAAAAACVLLYVDTLEYLRRGGRIGRAAALIGAALSVKPILTIEDGSIAPLERVRTASKALQRLTALAAEAVERIDGPYDIGVQHLTSESVAASIAESLATRLGRDTVPVDEVGADIGAHVGPGMIAVVVSPR